MRVIPRSVAAQGKEGCRNCRRVRRAGKASDAEMARYFSDRINRSWPRPARRRRMRRPCRAVSSICAISIPASSRTSAMPASNNFVGRPLAGYGAAECVVKREVGLVLKNDPAGTCAAKAVAENVRLLPAGARGRRHGGVVAGRQGDAGRAALQSGVQQAGSVPARLYRRALRPFHGRRTRSHAGRSERRQFGDVRSRQGLRRLHRAREARAPEGSVDMGTGYDCSDVKAHTAAKSITPAQRRWRNMLVLRWRGKAL